MTKQGHDKAGKEGAILAARFSNTYFFFFPFCILHLLSFLTFRLLAVPSRQIRTFSLKRRGPTFSTMIFGGPF